MDIDLEKKVCQECKGEIIACYYILDGEKTKLVKDVCGGCYKKAMKQKNGRED